MQRAVLVKCSERLQRVAAITGAVSRRLPLNATRSTVFENCFVVSLTVLDDRQVSTYDTYRSMKLNDIGPMSFIFQAPVSS
ncbi:hypothetical protein EVAR_83389_1 [Eumeta japonica]|uniref:Uncharacterized protein n=1 Tax=Eumeta variegata TaxID=151549 RepID=A0A4C1TYI3_EUMVA|nr:hypothetical protein EVAR_83389_1 [Eumeta japonica]